jgi:hypothetical protein
MYLPEGCGADRTMENMYGSAMNLIGTGIPYSQARRDLSSDVVTKRRFYERSEFGRQAIDGQCSPRHRK